MRNSISWVWR